jgi:hypothetical protein
MIPIAMQQKHISTNYVSSVMPKPENLEFRNGMILKMKKTNNPKQSAVKWSQIRRRIELYMREKILRFEMNLCN